MKKLILVLLLLLCIPSVSSAKNINDFFVCDEVNQYFIEAIHTLETIGSPLPREYEKRLNSLNNEVNRVIHRASSAGRQVHTDGVEAVRVMYNGVIHNSQAEVSLGADLIIRTMKKCQTIVGAK